MPITLDGTNGITTPMYNGSITANAVTPSVNMKNRIINGGMVIDQRNAGASMTSATNGSYSLDRWGVQNNSGASRFTLQQNAGSVTPPVGFSNYLGITSTSAYSIASGDVCGFYQNIEGFNTADLNWGTANAKTVTLSFWVRSSLTGTFGGAVKNSADNYSYPFTYTISATNTWEQKSITVAGPTAGTWVGATNGIGIKINFSLGTGADYSGTAGSWSGNAYYSATGATSVVGTNGATFYITGVQLEVGSTATSFDYRPYTTELQLCQRYFVAIISGTAKYFAMGSQYNSTTVNGVIPFPVTMRANPTSASSSGTNYYVFYRNGTGDDFNSITIEGASPQQTGFFNSTEISGTAGQAGTVYAQNASAFIAFQAEL